MQDPTITLLTTGAGDASTANESGISALSWPGIFAGALAMVALSLILVTVGSGFGLIPAHDGESMKKMTAVAAIGLILVQWVASAAGGYLTGRLRTQWVGVHTHEVFFRDTAHGFLAWAVAALFGVIALSSVFSTAAGHAHPMNRQQMQSMRESGPANGPMAYYIDSLYRNANAPMASATGANSSAMTPESVPVAGSEPSPPSSSPGVMAPVGQPANTAPANTESANPVAPVMGRPWGMPDGMMAGRIPPDVREETSRILTHAMGHNGLSDADRSYLVAMVSTHADMSKDAAANRVDKTYGDMTQEMEGAKKAVGYVALFTGLSMLVGAFVAAAAAAFGGSQRDEWEKSVRAGTYIG
jgi:hypothetical protein